MQKMKDLRNNGLLKMNAQAASSTTETWKPDFIRCSV